MSALVIHTQALYSQVHVHTNTYTVHYMHTQNEGEVMLHISATIKVEEWRAMEGEPQEEAELSVEAEGSRRSQGMQLLCRKAGVQDMGVPRPSPSAIAQCLCCRTAF